MSAEEVAALLAEGVIETVKADLKAASRDRVTSRPGAHQRTGRYARAALGGHAIDEHLAAFDDLRQVRNKTEYEAVLVAEAAAVEAIRHSRAVVDAVERDLA